MAMLQQGVKLFHCAVERFPMSALEELNSKFGAEVDISTNVSSCCQCIICGHLLLMTFDLL